jgi:hypothetical protein
MNIFASFNTQVNDLLQNICRKVQLSQTQLKLAEERYLAVADWLSKETSLLCNSKLTIYPQGSLRIGTTVKPVNQEEFDLDLICQLHIDYKKYTPEAVFSIVANRLQENQVYKKMMTLENRCIRLNYSGEFHLDIVPACPIDFNNEQNTGVVIPDKDKHSWRYTDPKGYAIWFDHQKEVLVLFAEDRSIEPLPPDYDNVYKTPLQYCIQLMKRYRDIAFEKEDLKIRPKSIVISTLAALLYKQQNSINSTLTVILNNISEMTNSTYPRLIVKNPVNESEDLTEAWDKNKIAYDAFCEWIDEFKIKWHEVNTSTDMNTIAPLLYKMFGELAYAVIKEQAMRVSEARNSRQLSVTNKTATLQFNNLNNSSMNKAPITGITFNTFFGD